MWKKVKSRKTDKARMEEAEEERGKERNKKTDNRERKGERRGKSDIVENDRRNGAKTVL